MAGTEAPSGRARRSRSPGYPAIPLDVAIQRAKKVYDNEGRNAAPIAALAAHWGFKAGTSSSNLSVSALKKFGLLSDEGSGESRLARLTDLAIDILLNPDPAEAIKTAALLPQIHRELYEKYGTSLPSDASLKHELIMTRGFTEPGADDFIGQFRKTLVFAQPDDASVQDREIAPSQESVATEPRTEAPRTVGPQAAPAWPQVSMPPHAGDRITIPIPLVGGETVQLSASFPISEAAWQQLVRVLEAMKPGLVVGPDHPSETN